MNDCYDDWYFENILCTKEEVEVTRLTEQFKQLMLWYELDVLVGISDEKFQSKYNYIHKLLSEIKRLYNKDPGELIALVLEDMKDSREALGMGKGHPGLILVRKYKDPITGHIVSDFEPKKEDEANITNPETTNGSEEK